MAFVYAVRNTDCYPEYRRQLALPTGGRRLAYLRKIRALGFDALELSVAALGGTEADESAIRALREELGAAGLWCAALRCNGDISRPEDWSRRNRALLHAAPQIGNWIGARLVTTTVTTQIVSGQPGDTGGYPTLQGASRDASAADFERTASELSHAADVAAQRGVSLSLELHHHSLMDNSASLLRMLRLVDRPNVGVNPDVKNIYWAYDVPEEPREAAIAALAPVASYWHCRNVTRILLPEARHSVFVRTPLGEGDINYRFMMSAMLDAGYAGDFALEGNISGDMLHVDGRSLSYLRALHAELQHGNASRSA